MEEAHKGGRLVPSAFCAVYLVSLLQFTPLFGLLCQKPCAQSNGILALTTDRLIMMYKDCSDIADDYESTAMTSPPVVAVVLSPSGFFANPSLSNNLVMSAGRKMRICGCPFESRASVANSTLRQREKSASVIIIPSRLNEAHSFRCLEMWRPWSC